jgi:hypothetical protein
LSKADAIHIADAEARKEMHVPLKYYEHSPVLYFAKEHRWYVGYQRKGKKFVDFAVDVYDKTGRASMVVFN